MLARCLLVGPHCVDSVVVVHARKMVRVQSSLSESSKEAFAIGPAELAGRPANQWLQQAGFLPSRNPSIAVDACGWSVAGRSAHSGAGGVDRSIADPRTPQAPRTYQHLGAARARGVPAELDRGCMSPTLIETVPPVKSQASTLCFCMHRVDRVREP